MGRKTLQGVETEYAIVFNAEEVALPDRGEVIGELFPLAHKRLIQLPDMQTDGCFLVNGFRFYLDAGLHPEVCTPECLLPQEVVCWIEAGERILLGLVDEVSLRYPGVEMSVYKTNVDYRAGTTWGTHESYAVKGSQREIGPRIMSHLISRIVYSGSGGFDTNSPNRAFLLSPRVPFLTSPAQWSAERPRALIHDRREPLGHAGYDRLHLMSGESLCSELSSYLKIGTTALVSRLGELERSRGASLAFDDPLAAMGAFARDPSCSVRVRLKDGRKLRAIDVQRLYLEEVEGEIGRGTMPDWAPQLCSLWTDTLDRLEKGAEAVASSLDWAMKLQLFRQHAGDSLDAGTPPPMRDALAEIDARFAQVGEKSLFAALDREGVLDHRVAHVPDVETAMVEAPRGGRAEARGAAIAELSGRPGVSCTWDRVRDTNGGRILVLDDPFDSKPAWKPFDGEHRDVRRASSRWYLPGVGALRRGIEHYEADRLSAAADTLGLAVRGLTRHPEDQALARFWRGCSLQDLGHVTRAEDVLSPALEQTRSSGSPETRARIWTRHALVMIERAAPLQEINRQIAEMEAAMGGLTAVGLSRQLYVKARLVLARGRNEEAISLLEQALDARGDDSVPFSEISYRRWLSRARVRLGDFDGARESFDQWESAVGSSAAGGMNPILAVERAHLALAEDDAERAFALMGPIVDQPSPAPSNRYRLGAVTVFVEAAVGCGRIERARELLTELLRARRFGISELRFEISRAHYLYASALVESGATAADELTGLQTAEAERATARRSLSRSAKFHDARFETDFWTRSANLAHGETR